VATVNYSRRGRVGLIALNRPAKLNAITAELRADLTAAIDDLVMDDDARVGILYGEGRAFCVGMDLSPEHHRAPRDAAEDRTDMEAMADDWLRLWDCPKPIIAQVHGYCFAGGTQLPLCCDIVAIAEDTVIGWPKLPVGGGWISPMWSFFIGAQRAKLLSFRVGSTLTGREAHDLGYAALVFPAATLADETFRIAEEIAKVPSDMLRIKKMANNRAMDAQGFRAAVLAGAEWDAIAHTTESVRRSREWIARHGLAGAVARFESEGM
jgi:enoyl-CoA hydratase